MDSPSCVQDIEDDASSTTSESNSSSTSSSTESAASTSQFSSEENLFLDPAPADKPKPETAASPVKIRQSNSNKSNSNTIHLFQLLCTNFGTNLEAWLGQMLLSMNYSPVSSQLKKSSTRENSATTNPEEQQSSPETQGSELRQQVFAQNLRSKLLEALSDQQQSLEDKTTEMPSQQQPPRSGNTSLKSLIERNHHLVSTALFGTTFPPSRTQLSISDYSTKAKFHSEIELSHEHQDLEDLVEKAQQQSSALLSGTVYNYKLNNNKSGSDPDGLNLLRDRNQQNSDQEEDSDLFFDFDIGSPQDDEDDLARELNLSEHSMAGDAAPEGSDNAEDNDDKSPVSVEKSDSGSPPNLETVPVPKDPEQQEQFQLDLGEAAAERPEAGSESSSLSDDHALSTAFGSTSSGLYSDNEAIITLKPSDDNDDNNEDKEADEVIEGLSLDPDDWIKNQGATFKEMMSLGKSKSIKASDQQQIETDANETETEADSADSKDSEDTLDGQERTTPKLERSSSIPTNVMVKDMPMPILKGGSVSIQIGDTEKHVAHSKLTALISLLERDRDREQSVRSNKSKIKSPSPSSAATSGSSSPTKGSVTIAVSKSKSPTPETGGASEPKSSSSTGLLSTSPANFSFLAGGVSKSLADEKCTMNVQATLERSHSTSLLNDMHHEVNKTEQQSCLNTSLSNVNKDGKEGNSSSSPKDKDVDTRSKYRRCSSLKSGKTPPGTPGQKKLVRFADVFGLDLAEVKSFLDEVPRVPKSAFQDLTDAELSDLDSDSGSERTASSRTGSHRGGVAATGSQFTVHPPTCPPDFRSTTSGGTPTLSALFNQPSGCPNFFSRLRDKKVSLESAYMSDVSTIKGIVRVINIDFHKRVFVRCTLNSWETSFDVEGTYLPGSNDGFSDKFSFAVDCNEIKGHVGRQVQFCVCFVCANNQYWDNNNGKNYAFQVFGTPAAPRPHPQRGATSAATGIPKPMASISGSAHDFGNSPSAISDDPWTRFF